MKPLHLCLALLTVAACNGDPEGATAAGPDAMRETQQAAAPGEQADTPAPPAPTPAAAPSLPQRYGYEIVATFPHDPAAFTQGLFWQDGHLYEGTGRHGQSSLRKVAPQTGEVIQRHDIPQTYFGEGIAPWGDTIVGITWRSGKGFVYDAQDFSVDGEFTYTGEGWGLTANDTHLVMSDGTDVIRFLDPETFEIERRLNVTLAGRPLIYLNELEWVDGAILANVWQQDAIVRIDPATGAVTGIVDMRGLAETAGIERDRDKVLNGIAWDAETGRLFVTGKNWPSLYEIRLVEMP